MSNRRQVWETLAHLLQRVETSSATPPPAASDSASLEQEIRKMGKTQLKANLLTEEQNAQVKQALAAAQAAQEQNTFLRSGLPPPKKTRLKRSCRLWTASNTPSPADSATCKSAISPLNAPIRIRSRSSWSLRRIGPC